MVKKKKTTVLKKKNETKQESVSNVVANVIQTTPKSFKNIIFAGIGIIITSLVIFVALIAKSTSQWSVNTNMAIDDQIIESNESQGELPQFFPENFPIYENAKLQNNWTTQSTNITGVSVAWETLDSPTKVFNFYFTELRSLGYKVEVLSQTTSAYTLSLEKDLVSGFIGITQVDKKALISITLGIKNGQ